LAVEFFKFDIWQISNLKFEILKIQQFFTFEILSIFQVRNLKFQKKNWFHSSFQPNGLVLFHSS
jgi:hypothetical protein